MNISYNLAEKNTSTSNLTPDEVAEALTSIGFGNRRRRRSPNN